jgi:hypothetical protein
VSSGNTAGAPIAVAPVAVSNGVFTVTLDFGAGAFTGANRWLELGVRANGSAAAYSVLSPRQPVTSTPYAIQSLNAATAVTANSATTATTANSAATATSATNFTGSLTGDVTGTQGATVVSSVAGQSAANVAGGASAANAATSANTASAIVRRDASGNFTAGTVTATFSGSGASLTSLNAAQLDSGTVPAAALGNAWKLAGNSGTTPGTHFVGTTDNQALEFKVNGSRVLRLEPNINVIGGAGNTADSSVSGATIAGGINNTIQANANQSSQREPIHDCRRQQPSDRTRCLSIHSGRR